MLSLSPVSLSILEYVHYLFSEREKKRKKFPAAIWFFFVQCKKTKQKKNTPTQISPKMATTTTTNLQNLLLKTLLLAAGFTSLPAARAQLPTTTTTGNLLPTLTTPSLTIATVPNPTATALPDLVRELPTCAIPCFESAARAINCAVTDFSCLCRAGNAASLSVNVGTCIGGGQLLGGSSSNDNDNDNNDGCELEDLGELATLAGQICSAIANNPNQSQLAAATTIVSEALARASATAAATTGAGRQNAAVRAERAGTGMLAVVAAYAVFVL